MLGCSMTSSESTLEGIYLQSGPHSTTTRQTSSSISGHHPLWIFLKVLGWIPFFLIFLLSKVGEGAEETQARRVLAFIERGGVLCGGGVEAGGDT